MRKSALLGNPRARRFKHDGEHSMRVQDKTHKLIILWEPNTDILGG